MAAKLQKVIFIMQTLVDKLQFIGLIGGRVCNPRQQQVLSIYFSFTQNTFAIFIAPDNTYRNK